MSAACVVCDKDPCPTPERCTAGVHGVDPESDAPLNYEERRALTAVLRRLEDAYLGPSATEFQEVLRQAQAVAAALQTRLAAVVAAADLKKSEQSS